MPIRANELELYGVSVVEPWLSEEHKWLSRDEQQDGIVMTYGLTKKNRRRYVSCGKCHRTFKKWACENGHQWAVGQDSCGSRLCPHCAHYRAGVLGGRLQTFLFGSSKSNQNQAKDTRSMRYAVLTVRNTSSLLVGFLLIWKAWMRIRRSALWKRYVDGSMVVFEVTFSREKGWHPHLNLLLDGKYFPVEALHQAWSDAANGEGEVVHIKAVTTGTAKELIKYVCKSSDLIGQPDAVDEFHEVLDARRLVRTYGTFYGLKTADEEKPGVECPICQKPDVACVELGWIETRQLRLDPLYLREEVYGVEQSPPEEVEYRHFYPVWFKGSCWKPQSGLLNAMDRLLQPSKQAFAAETHTLWDEYLAHGRAM